MIAAVSSVLPSPTAPKSFTLRKTWYVEGFALYAAVPWCLIDSSQKGSPGADVPLPNGVEHDEPRPDTVELSPRIMLAVSKKRFESMAMRLSG